MIDDDERSMLVVSVMGPPNAGKSTLFNRLMCKEANRAYRLASDKKPRNKRGAQGRVGHKNPSNRPGGAIVSSTPGTTRDRRECIGRIGGTTFRLVDTAGVDGEKIGHLVSKTSDPMERKMIQQTLKAAKAADLVLLMFDARVGVTTDLAETARWLRKVGPVTDDMQHREVRILANKLEGDAWSANYDSPVLGHLEEAARVGFGEAIPISAEHGEGLADVAAIIEDLTEAKRERLGIAPANENDEDADNAIGSALDEKPLQLAILGRQNVGKSTLVNALLKEERVITGSTPGLTRDSIAVKWSWQGRPVQLADTAGIRKSAKRERSDNIEDLAVQDAMRSMKMADVALLVLDGEARMLQRQELAIADAVVREGRSLVVAANKMDILVEDDYTPRDYATAVQQQIEIRFPMLRKTPVVPMSSLTGENVHRLMPVVFDARDRWQQVISTGMLNRWLSEVLDTQAPPLHNGRPINIKYIMQTKGRPPTFLLFCNVDELPTSYLRYLTRNFQETFQMYGMEVRMAIKKSAENPFENKKKSKSTGIGGWEGRQKRMIKSLKKTGAPPPKKKRKSYKRR